MTGADPGTRLGRWLGWAAGGLAGVLVSYLLWSASAERGFAYPTEPATFALFVAGAFGGMALAPRLGHRAPPVLASALALLLVLVVVLAAAR